MHQSSYWEKDVLLGPADLVVIGSGLVGLSAALTWKKQRPNDKVVVLERGTLPTGASTRNAGFACFGSSSELLDDLSERNPKEVWDLVAQRWEGLQYLRNLIGDSNLDYESHGGFEVFLSGERDRFNSCKEALPELNRQLEHITGEVEVFRVEDHRIASFGFAGVEHLITNRLEGQLHPGKMIRHLLLLVQEAGVQVLTGTEVQEVQDRNGHLQIHLAGDLTYTTHAAIVATNGFANRLIPGLDLRPARNQVLITDPIPGLAVKGCFHYDRGYYYFRNVGDRLLFGGGRNLQPKQEQTDSFGLTNNILQPLEDLLDTHFLKGVTYSISDKWSGILGVGPQKTPIFRLEGERLFLAVRLGGMGVALGTKLGADAANEFMKIRFDR